MFTAATFSPTSSTGNARKRLRSTLAPISASTGDGSHRTSPGEDEDAPSRTSNDTALTANKLQVAAQSKQIQGYSHANSRLRNQVSQLTTNERRHKQLLSEVRTQYEATLAHLKSEHESMLLRILDIQDEASSLGVDEDVVPISVMDSKCNMYEQRMKALEEENMRLKDGLESQAKVIASNLVAEKEAPERLSETISPAPPDVMRELTRLRVKLADEERQNRMLKRTNDELLPKARSYAVSKELAKRSEENNKKLEQQVQNMQQEKEITKIQEQQWNEFQKNVRNLPGLESTVSKSPSEEKEGPPEIATIIRRIKNLERSANEANQSQIDCEKALKSARVEILDLKVSLNKSDKRVKEVTSLNTSLKKELNDLKEELAKSETSERIYKKENHSLRELLETYEEMENPSFKPYSVKKNPTIDGLRVSLKSAQDSNKVLKEELVNANNKIQALSTEISNTDTEHQRVLEKFGKLREALMQEKEKVKGAEDRAVEAETLAGKGLFNTETTRVLHLQQNPLTHAIRDKYEKIIKDLNEDIKLLKAGGVSTGVSGGKISIGSDVDAQKLHQRLKESFKEQISVFREGVYLLTGYKIDMIAGEQADRPRFKVRSMYAEREDDYLMFMWPDVKRTKTITMLDLLSTEFAKTLAKTEEFEYVTRFNSIPGFLASLTVKLFDDQTCIG